jgi:hypothetical protein
MPSASLVMRGPFGVGGAGDAPFAPTPPPPQAFNTIAAAVMLIARRISPSKKPGLSIFAMQQAASRPHHAIEMSRCSTSMRPVEEHSLAS